jgi:hypothetical protein
MNTPILDKPLSRWNAPYWAMANGIAAGLNAADWSVLCALYFHLPKAIPGVRRISRLSGRSESTVCEALKRLGDFGLIEYTMSDRGRRLRTSMRVADPRLSATVKAFEATIAKVSDSRTSKSPKAGDKVSDSRRNGKTNISDSRRSSLRKPEFKSPGIGTEVRKRRAQGKDNAAGAASGAVAPVAASPLFAEEVYPGQPSAQETVTPTASTAFAKDGTAEGTALPAAFAAQMGDESPGDVERLSVSPTVAHMGRCDEQGQDDDGEPLEDYAIQIKYGLDQFAVGPVLDNWRALDMNCRRAVRRAAAAIAFGVKHYDAPRSTWRTLKAGQTCWFKTQLSGSESIDLEQIDPDPTTQQLAGYVSWILTLIRTEHDEFDFGEAKSYSFDKEAIRRAGQLLSNFRSVEAVTEHLLTVRDNFTAIDRAIAQQLPDPLRLDLSLFTHKLVVNAANDIINSERAAVRAAEQYTAEEKDHEPDFDHQFQQPAAA